MRQTDIQAALRVWLAVHARGRCFLRAYVFTLTPGPVKRDGQHLTLRVEG